MSNEEQHKNVIAGKDNSIKIKGGLEVEGDLTLKGESAGLGGSGAFSEEEMRRLLAAGNVTAPAPEWIDDTEVFNHTEGHINTAANDLASLLKTDARNYRSFVVGGHYSYTITPEGNSNYNFTLGASDLGSDPSLTGAKTGDTYTFKNSSGSHPLEIVNSSNEVVATQSGEVTTFTPTATGTYTYRCQTHPGAMTGSIVVEQGGDSTFEITGSTRRTGNNPGNLSEDNHPEVFALRFLVVPDALDPGDSTHTHNFVKVTAIGLLGEHAVKECSFSIQNLAVDDAPSWADAPGALVTSVLERDSSGNEGAWQLGRMMAKRRSSALDADGNAIDSDPATFTHPDRYLIHDNGSGDKDSFELVSGTFAGAASPQVLNGGNTGQTLTDILQFKAGFEPDFETKTQYTIIVRAYNDYVIGEGDTGKYSDHTFTINITDSKWDNAPIWEPASIGIPVYENGDTRPTSLGGEAPTDSTWNMRTHLKGTSVASNGSVSAAGSDNPNAANYTFQIINGTGGLVGSSSAGSNVATTHFHMNAIDGENVFLSYLPNGDRIEYETINAAWGGTSLGSTPTFNITIRATNPLEGRYTDKIVQTWVNNDPTDDAPVWIHGGSTGTASSATPVQIQEPQTGASFTWGLDLSDLIHGSQRSTTTFAIEDYADGDKFEMVGGDLKFINPPDYENPTDVTVPGDQSGNNNIYAVQLTATNSKGVGAGDSGGRSSQQIVYIQVTDRTADNTAHWPSNVDTSHTIDELSPNLTEVYTIPGGGQYTHDYVITSNPHIGGNTAPFHLAGPVIKTSGTIDLTNEQDTTFNLIIAARNVDGAQGDSKTFAITVANVLTDEFDMNNPFEFTVEP